MHVSFICAASNLEIVCLSKDHRMNNIKRYTPIREVTDSVTVIYKMFNFSILI